MNAESVQLSYNTLSKILDRSIQPYKVPTLVIIGIGFLIMLVLLFNDVNYLWAMAPFVGPSLVAFVLYTIYLRYPTGVALTDYLEAVKRSRLSGDDLITQKTLLTKVQLQKLFNQNGDDFHGDPDAISTQVVEGLKHLTFQGKAYGDEYEAIVLLIKGWNERKKR